MPILISPRQYFVFLDESQGPNDKNPFFFIIEKGTQEFNPSESRRKKLNAGGTPAAEKLNTSDEPINAMESTLTKVGSLIFWLGFSCVAVAAIFYFSNYVFPDNAGDAPEPSTNNYPKTKTTYFKNGVPTKNFFTDTTESPKTFGPYNPYGEGSSIDVETPPPLLPYEKTTTRLRVEDESWLLKL